MSVKRLALAVVVSSFAVVPLYLAVAIVMGDLDNMFLSVMLIAALGVSIAGVVFVGLPLHFLLVRLNKVRGVYYGLFGFIVPALVTLIIHPFGEDGLRWLIIQSVCLGLFGALIALIFWKVVTFESNAQ